MWYGWRTGTAAAEHAALLGLGTNLGDRTANLRAAVVGLRTLGSVVTLSRVYESEPYGYADQPRFLNMAVKLRTELAPADLLAAVKALETRIGRVPARRMGPRLIDIDILFYDSMVVDAPDLRIPHPGVMDRAFVLAPLLDLEIGMRHPVTAVLLADRMVELDDHSLAPLGSARDVLHLADDTRHA
jgi:2-amino-4-hydroxy-6-hydroxymethyldihydropteridine diphosphokinase